MEPDIVFDAVFAEIALQAGNVFGQSKIGDCLFQRFEIAVNISVAVLGRKVFGVLDNVGALVAFGRQRAGFLPFELLQVADGQAFAKLFDLVAGIVDVKLTGHVVAGPVQAGCQAVAQRAAAGVAHMHRAGRVGRNKLHIVFLSGAGVGAAVFRFGAGRAQRVGKPGIAQKQVDKTGAGNFNPLKQAARQVQRADNRFGNLARRFAEGARAGHGEVAGRVAVLYVGRDFDDESRQFGFGQGAGGHGGTGGFGQQGTSGVQCGLAGVVTAVIHEYPPCWEWASVRTVQTFKIHRGGQLTGVGSGATVISTRLRLIKFSPPESRV